VQVNQTQACKRWAFVVEILNMLHIQRGLRL
jgi:hypothetical protein